MIRKANIGDISRIAEILIFGKRTAYRNIFNNDKVSFGEMTVLPLALSYAENPDKLHNVFVYEKDFVRGMMSIDIGEILEVKELYVDPFFQKEKIGSHLLSYAENLAHRSEERRVGKECRL